MSGFMFSHLLLCPKAVSSSPVSAQSDTLDDTHGLADDFSQNHSQKQKIYAALIQWPIV